MNKIYITGSVGSGKSTLGKNLAKEFGFAYCELDSVIYKPYAESTSGNRKRSIEDKDALISDVLSSERWIIEDSGRKEFEYIWDEADSIILLDPPKSLRNWRIVSRWIKQMLHVEKCGYRPGFYMLKNMIKWARDYDKGELQSRLRRCEDKLSILRNLADVELYIEKLKEVSS